LLLNESSFILQSPFISPFIKVGILLNTVFYAALALMIYSKHKNKTPVDLIVNLGKMTLTNYLSVSALMILTLYGIGLGLLPSIHIYQLWLMAVVWTALLMFFSNQWLSNHRYGPAEWIWRQLSWMKRISNKK
ncbi:MAG: DUF418 domain-containing protein, partial [Bacteroidota bacterium]